MRTVTGLIKRGRKEWFGLMCDAYQNLWCASYGHKPSLQEARQRLEQLRQNGPSPEAFTFKKTFPPPDAERPLAAIEDSCPAY
jgi:hypothetical protein